MIYLLHCNKCDHEWESVEKDSGCAWCGSSSYILKAKENWVRKIRRLLKE